MSDTLTEQVEALLNQWPDPESGAPLADSKAVRAVAVSEGKASAEVVLGYPARSLAADLARRLEQAITEIEGIDQASVGVDWRVVPHQVQDGLTPLEGVKNILAVASGKGGVGKSTTAVNLALALSAEGATVGLLDADVYGPSIPRMMGLSGRPETHDQRSIEPMLSYGVQCMSIGLLVDEQTAMVWRGPMVTQALQQLLGETRWRDLDYLVIDLPPGTGDTQLTLAQKVPVSGAVIVTTPQDIALLDAVRGIKMFEKVSVAVLGVVENMSVHRCSACGHEESIFGTGGGERIARDHGVDLLGALPLDLHIREQADSGKPTVVAAPDSEAAASYRKIARATAARLALRARSMKGSFPKIVIE